MNETSVNISWEGVPCSQKNGEIISYSVNYCRVGDDVKLTPVSTMMSEQTLTLSGLRPLTRYSVSVAAVNGNGTGPASPPVTIATTIGMHIHNAISLIYLHVLLQDQCWVYNVLDQIKAPLSPVG